MMEFGEEAPFIIVGTIINLLAVGVLFVEMDHMTKPILYGYIGVMFGTAMSMIGVAYAIYQHFFKQEECWGCKHEFKPRPKYWLPTEEGAKPDPEYCWGCRDGQFYPGRKSGQDKNADELWELYQSMRNQLTDQSLSVLIADHFEKDIFIPAKAEGKKVSFWGYDDILRHLKWHLKQ